MTTKRVFGRIACQCGDCGHCWFAEKLELPKRCPKRECRSIHWNTDEQGEVRTSRNHPIEDEQPVHETVYEKLDW